MYDVVPYYLSKILSELPSFVVPPLIATVITFFAYGFTLTTENFFKFLLNSICNTLVAISYGYLISTGVTNPEAAMQLSPVVIMPLMLVGGMYMNAD